MKVLVTKYLNVRVGRPSVNAPSYQYLAPGSELNIDGKLYAGDTYDGIAIWYKDEAGNYYWSGGVEETNEILNAFEDQGRLSKTLSEYPGDGNGIGVAILDSGIDENNPHLKNRIQLYESFLAGKSKQNISDHGTQVAGIITSDDTRIIRNTSDVYCMRVAHKNDSIDNYAVQLALERIKNDTGLSRQISIINMSIDIIPHYISRLQPIIDDLLNEGIISIVAGGQNGQINNISNLKDVIKVGVFDHRSYKNIKRTGLPENYSIALLDIPIPSYSVGNNDIDSKINQDSAYCAFISALIAREWSRQMPPVPNRLNDALRFLHDQGESIIGSIKPEPFKIYM